MLLFADVTKAVTQLDPWTLLWTGIGVALGILLKDLSSTIARIATVGREARIKRNDELVAERLGKLFEITQRYRSGLKDLMTVPGLGFETTETPVDLWNRVNGLRTEFRHYLLPSEIYLPQDVFEETKKLGQTFSKVLDDAGRALRSGLEEAVKGFIDSDTKSLQDWEKFWKEAESRMDKEAEPLFEKIKVMYRKRLGVT